MILIPYSYNGTQLNNGHADVFGIGTSTDYQTLFPRASANLQIQANAEYVKRSGAVPVYAGKDFQPHVINLEVNMLHSFTTLFERLNTLFNTRDETPRQFVCTDVDYASSSDYVQYYVYATAKQVLGGHDGTMAVVTLALDDPIWQSVTQNSQTFSITASTDSTSVTVNGNDESYPIFEITPTSQPSTDYLYNLYLQVLPTSTDPWVNRPINVTGSSDTTWDTAALIASGKMQASSDPGGAGGDIRLFRDSVEVFYWLSGINSTDTKVWTYADMPPAQNMTLKTALTTDTVTEIVINPTNANKDIIKALPDTGRLIVDTSLGSTDSEEFTYTSKVVSGNKLVFNVSARGVRNSAIEAHAAGSNVRFLPYDFNLLYGNLTTSAPTIDDNYKPIIDLTNSTNSSFVFSNFYVQNALRPAIWLPQVLRVSNSLLTRSGVYTSTNDEGDTDPATVMGLMSKSYEAVSVWKGDTVQLAWLNYFPDVVSSVSNVTGEQTQNVAGIPKTYLQAMRSETEVARNLWQVDAQTTTDYGTLTTWTKASSDADLPPNTKYLRFFQTGSITGSTDNYNKVGVTAMTVGLTNYPHVMMRSESLNYKLHCRIYNETTGDYMDIVHPMALNETLYIDTDPDFPNAKYKGLIVNGAVQLSSVRARWLRLAAGENTIGFESSLSGASNITIVIKWRDRMNFF